MTNKLNAKQQRFIEEYLSAGCDYRAIGVQVDLVPAGGWYVYFLTDPRDGLIFYVGKGRGSRKHVHLASVRNNREANHEKEKRIRSILRDGLEPECFTFCGFGCENQALDAERALIAELKEHGLTNISPGRRSAAEIVIEQAKSMLARMKPKERWLNEASNKQLASAARTFGSPEAAYDWMIRCVNEVIEYPPSRVVRLKGGGSAWVYE